MMHCVTEWSKDADVPPKVRSRPELDVAATPPDWKKPVPLIVELEPPGSPVVRTVHTARRYQGPERDDTGTV